MKKFLAFVLALTVMLACFPALADLNTKPATTTEAPASEDGEVRFSFTKEEYAGIFDQMAAGSKLSLTWASDPLDTFGYPMYYCCNETENIFTVVHDYDGVIGIEVDVFTNMDQLNTDIPFDQQIGATFACAHHTAYVITHPDCTQEDILAVNQQIQTLMLKINNIGVEGADTQYVETIGDLITRFSWVVEDENITLYFSVLPLGSQR